MSEESMIKVYACKFCKKWTNRREARNCIKTHVLVDKEKRTRKHPPRQGPELNVSNISKLMLRKEFKEE